MQIQRFVDQPERHDDIAALMTLCWPEYYGPTGRGDALADVMQRARPHGVPAGLMAIDTMDSVIGTVALTDTSYGALPGEAPWVVGLCTLPQCRNTGVATRLVAAVMALSKVMDATRMFATTRHNGGVFRKQDWRFVRVVDENGWEVWTTDLNEKPRPHDADGAIRQRRSGLLRRHVPFE